MKKMLIRGTVGMIAAATLGIATSSSASAAMWVYRGSCGGGCYHYTSSSGGSYYTGTYQGGTFKTSTDSPFDTVQQ